MGAELQKPYTIDEIEQHPKAVIISLLIGLLLMAIGWNMYREGVHGRREDALVDKADKEKTSRIELYEKMIFYKGETERLVNEQTASDSLVRERTQLSVQKILNRK